MKLEKISKSKKNKIIVGGLIGLGIIGAITILPSQAKYKLTESIKIGTGEVNYKVPDFNIMALYLQNDDSYEEISVMPGSGVLIDENNSYCSVNGVKDNSAILKTINGNHTIANLSKGSKCYLYFKNATTIEEMLISLQKDNSRSENITQAFTASTPTTVYTKNDYDGLSYIFSGKNPNNWVKYAGFYWRIIRVNGNGSLRLIYNGTSTDETGDSTQIGTSSFNTYEGYMGDNTYVGYMYGKAKASSYEETHANTNSSQVKNAIDEWYVQYIKGKEYEKYIDNSVGFCGDRTAYTFSDGVYTPGGGNYVTGTTYGPRIRLAESLPILTCPNTNDYYTKTDQNVGNKALVYSIGLITSDEVMLAGGHPSETNKEYYLYTGKMYWTMSPYFVTASYGYTAVYPVYSDGKIFMKDQYISTFLGVRPVINIKNNITFSKGNGTQSNPYEII